MSNLQLVAVLHEELPLAAGVDDLDGVRVVFPIGGENDADGSLPTTACDHPGQLDNGQIRNLVEYVKSPPLIRRHNAAA